ncbi:hypothetical protein CSC88_23265, partial [Klebsiella pneumoniae]
MIRLPAALRVADSWPLSVPMALLVSLFLPSGASRQRWVAPGMWLLYKKPVTVSWWRMGDGFLFVRRGARRPDVLFSAGGTSGRIL